MPSNYTPNYNLNQWEPGDAVLRTDFNADNAKLDTAIAGKADTSALEALARTVAGKADVSALNSLAQTVTGQGSAIGKLGNCRIETFAYTGTSTGSSTTIRFSARPALFLVISDMYLLLGSGKDSAHCVFCNAAGSVGLYRLTMNWSASQVTLTGGDSAFLANNAGHTYRVVAFHAEDES